MKDRKLHAFTKGISSTSTSKEPSNEETEMSSWVTREKVSKLIFKMEEGRNVIFQMLSLNASNIICSEAIKNGQRFRSRNFPNSSLKL